MEYDVVVNSLDEVSMLDPSHHQMALNANGLSSPTGIPKAIVTDDVVNAFTRSSVTARDGMVTGVILTGVGRGGKSAF